MPTVFVELSIIVTTKDKEAQKIQTGHLLVLTPLEAVSDPKEYLQMSSKCVEVEEFAGLIAIAVGLHLTTEQDVTSQ